MKVGRSLQSEFTFLEDGRAATGWKFSGVEIK